MSSFPGPSFSSSMASIVIPLVALVLIFSISFWLSSFLSTLVAAKRRRKHYENEGVPGPRFRHVVGNLAEVHEAVNKIPNFQENYNLPSMLRVIPDLCAFHKAYGNVFVYELGSVTRLVMADPVLAVQVLNTFSSNYHKGEISRQILKHVLGNGVVLSDGELWKQQRRVLDKGFKVDYLQGLVKHMMVSGEGMLRRWNSRGAVFEIDALLEMGTVTLEIIARTSFGAELGTTKAPAAYETLDGLLKSGLGYLNSFRRLLPGFSFLHELCMVRRERSINRLLTDIVKARISARNEHQERNLLDMMLEAVKKDGSRTMTMQQLLDECKAIFFTGHSTTATVLTWTLILLSIHQDWQQRAREEILQVFGCFHNDATLDKLESLETVKMIVYEILRLYPPVSTITRECQRNHNIGGINILPRTQVVIPMLMLLQRKDLWGEDAYEFKPERFRNKKARDFPAFMVFGTGPRMCLGMNFALIEAKLLLSLMLSNFSFHLSEDYQHAPGTMLSMKPLHGSPLVVKRLQ